MRIEITKGRDQDSIAILRDDGTAAATRFPHKGPVPHDAVHLIVERGLRMRSGFWGQVARGIHPEDLAAMAKAGGHASAKRAAVPDGEIVEMIQAERLVECFEADLWDGGGADADLLAVAAVGCAASRVAMPSIEPAAVARIRGEIAQFAAEWQAAPIGHVAKFNWQTFGA